MDNSIRLEHLVMFFECEVGRHAHKIDIAAPLANAVDRPLNLNRAAIDSNQRIGNGQFTIIVAVDAQGSGKFFAHGIHSRCDLFGHRPPLVSHRQSRAAPESAAALNVFKANSGLALNPSKKCSAS